MPFTITINDIHILSIMEDYVKQCVTVIFCFVKDTGEDFDGELEAIFWVTIPDPGTDPNGIPLPPPDNWFQLPASYFPMLIQMRDDAKAAIIARFVDG